MRISICASSARTVSSATPTTMIIEVPPREMPLRDAEVLKWLMRIGTIAIMPR